ncbi:mitochondrial 37S ribosomal protein uS9m SCDLUD_005121 [Saccharomycodes ludwigii]|uniref:mitochondrial 37S ribosomal protein uS9m n=1 Tax=Saccharomycodes ludwigii TaxID=36035 RepID=UPI001E8908E6|nr:hypothetical protein SCDLUD_005121 [Saccharomycodes ludwigii]KAH3898786.1 hypothetical protein SCDLUD_005121 [Saccharomycodes ludwigii]
MLKNVFFKPSWTSIVKQQASNNKNTIGLARYLSNDSYSNTRIVPKLNTFYSANPQHEHNMNEINFVLEKYKNLIKYQQSNYDKTATAENKERPHWLSVDDYAILGGGTRLKPIQYEELVEKLNNLYYIDNELANDEILGVINKYIRNSSNTSTATKIPQLDPLGRSVSIGGRKSSTAKVYVVKGEGQILVNNQKQLTEYFTKLKDRKSIIYPLQVIDQVGKFNIYITCSGGGVTGQAEAAMHAISKSLLAFNPLWKSRLHKSGVLSRDYRHVERKKPGKKKARKMPTWVKR